MGEPSVDAGVDCDCCLRTCGFRLGEVWHDIGVESGLSLGWSGWLFNDILRGDSEVNIPMWLSLARADEVFGEGDVFDERVFVVLLSLD